MLSLKAFLPTAEKVQQVELHPTQSWIATATKADHVSVWDWSSQQTVREFQLGGSEEELLQDVDIGRSSATGPSGLFQPNPSLMQPAAGLPSRTATGHVKDLKFLDADTVQVQLTSQHYLVNGSGSVPPSAEGVTALAGMRLLIVVCEYKTLVVDLLSRKVTEVPKAALDGKTATCCAVMLLGGGAIPGGIPGSLVMRRPAIAFGCSDGVVRILQWGTWQPICRLVSSHKSAITCIVSLQSRGTTWEQVVAGHAYGSVCAWEPFSRAMGALPGGDMPAQRDVKAHDKEVLSLMLACVGEDPESLKRSLFSAGVDNRVVGWDCDSLKETAKFKLDAKAQTTAVGLCHRGFVANGSATLLVGTEAGMLLSCHAVTGSMRLIANLAVMIPAGTKKQPKIYWVASHPLQPHIIACGTNTGAVLLSAPDSMPLTVAPLPLLSPLQAHRPLTPPPPGSAAAGLASLLPTTGCGSGVTFLLGVGDTVVCVAASTHDAAGKEKERKDKSRPASGSSKLEDLLNAPTDVYTGTTISYGQMAWARARVVARAPIAKDRPSHGTLITASFDGSYVAVVWPAARQYAVYAPGASGAAPWDEISTGFGSSVAWHAAKNMFAVVEDLQAPTAPAPGPLKDAKKGFGSMMRKEKEKDGADAVDASRAPSFGSSLVKIWMASGRSVTVLHHGLHMHVTDRPVAVVSGPLLAVSLRKTCDGCDLVAGRDGAGTMQLFGWEDAGKAGPELPEPLLMSWDQSLNFAALAYSSQVVVCATQPAFKAVASLPVAGVVGMAWAARQLYLLTATSAVLAFVGLPSSGTAAPHCPVHTVTLMSFSDGMTVAPVGLRPSGSATLVPTPVARPPGELAILGPRDGALWLLNSYAQPLALSMNHAGLSAMCAVASGDAAGALMLVASELPHSTHDAFAAFLIDMDGPRAGAAALTLPGLSLPAQARLRMGLKQWQQAMEDIEGLLSGRSDRPESSECPATRQAFRTDEPTFSARGAYGLQSYYVATAARGDNGDGAAAPRAARAARGDTGAPQFDGELDWTLPLRSAAPLREHMPQRPPPLASSMASASRGSLEWCGAAARLAPPARLASAIVQSGIELAMDLIEALNAGGQSDVASHAIKLLLSSIGAQGLGEDRMSRVALAMADASMRHELSALATAGVTSAAGCAAPGGSLLLAAALSGDSPALGSVLQQLACAGLRAAHAKVHGLSDAPEALEKWRAELRGAAGGPGAPHLTVFN